MIKKRFVLMFVLCFALNSCSTVRTGYNDEKDRYNMMTRLDDIHSPDYKKNANRIEGIIFLVANEPDIMKYYPSEKFEYSYNKLITYLNNHGYVVVSNYKLNKVATIVARVPKPMPDMLYIAVSMEYNRKYDEIIYNVVYGGNVFKATQFYNNYVKTL